MLLLAPWAFNRTGLGVFVSPSLDAVIRFFHRTQTAVDPQLRERLHLPKLHTPTPGELEPSEEGHHAVHAILERSYEPAEFDAPHTVERAENQVHLVVHRNGTGGNQTCPNTGIGRRHLESGREHLFPRGFQLCLLHRWADARLQEAFSEPPSALGLRRGQAFADLPNLLVLQEPAYELCPGILILRVAVPRQEQLRLDSDKAGRHLQEFSGIVEIRGLNVHDGAEELMRDQRDGDLENVDVLLPDQMKQEIQRSLESLDVDDKEVLLSERTRSGRQIHRSIRASARPIRAKTGQSTKLKNGG